MKRKKKRMTRTLSFATTDEQMEKLESVAKMMGVKISAVVRALIDSALPEVDADDQYWRRVAASGIFGMDLPREAIIPYIASWLHLSLTGIYKLGNIEIVPCPERGISPTLWALERIRRAFYDKGVCERPDKQDEPTDEAPLPGGDGVSVQEDLGS